nr:hypothetical protein [Tanacetum cinerariifolium]
MASVQNSTDPGPTRHSKASAHDSSDPGLTRHSKASLHNSSDPGPTCLKMASVQISSDPAPKCQTMALEHNRLSPAPNCQENVSHRDKTGTTSNELDLLFSPMFDELLNGSSKVVTKSSVVSAADAPNQRQQPTTPLNTHTTPAPTCQNPPITTTVISSENIYQAEPHAENAHVADDEFINIFSTPVQDQGETSSRHVDSSNMHTFYQRYPSEQHWTNDHPLEQVIGNPLQSVRTRRQQESDAEMCMFALTVVSMSSAVSAADAPNQRQQPTTPLNTHTTPAPTCQNLPITTSVISSENITQVEPHAESDQGTDDEFINIFSTPVHDQGETSSRHVEYKIGLTT